MKSYAICNRSHFLFEKGSVYETDGINDQKWIAVIAPNGETVWTHIFNDAFTFVLNYPSDKIDKLRLFALEN